MLKARRHGRGFEALGAGGSEGLPLPRQRARELALADVWRKEAGPVLAGRARALRVERGVLEIEVPERRWADALRTQIPALAARAAAALPEQHIRKFRMRLADGTELLPAEPLHAGAAPSAPRRRAKPARKAASAPPADETSAGALPERLRDLAARYLARAAVTSRRRSPLR
jgi:predicted nucleic acid-binding Zn ribbon protein